MIPCIRHGHDAHSQRHRAPLHRARGCPVPGAQRGLSVPGAPGAPGAGTPPVHQRSAKGDYQLAVFRSRGYEALVRRAAQGGGEWRGLVGIGVPLACSVSQGRGEEREGRAVVGEVGGGRGWGLVREGAWGDADGGARAVRLSASLPDWPPGPGSVDRRQDEGEDWEMGRPEWTSYSTASVPRSHPIPAFFSAIEERSEGESEGSSAGEGDGDEDGGGESGEEGEGGERGEKGESGEEEEEDEKDEPEAEDFTPGCVPFSAPATIGTPKGAPQTFFDILTSVPLSGPSTLQHHNTEPASPPATTTTTGQTLAQWGHTGGVPRGWAALGRPLSGGARGRGARWGHTKGGPLLRAIGAQYSDPKGAISGKSVDLYCNSNGPVGARSVDPCSDTNGASGHKEVGVHIDVEVAAYSDKAEAQEETPTGSHRGVSPLQPPIPAAPCNAAPTASEFPSLSPSPGPSLGTTSSSPQAVTPPSPSPRAASPLHPAGHRPLAGAPRAHPGLPPLSYLVRPRSPLGASPLHSAAPRAADQLPATSPPLSEDSLSRSESVPPGTPPQDKSLCLEEPLSQAHSLGLDPAPDGRQGPAALPPLRRPSSAGGPRAPPSLLGGHPHQQQRHRRQWSLLTVAPTAGTAGLGYTYGLPRPTTPSPSHRVPPSGEAQRDGKDVGGAGTGYARGLASLRSTGRALSERAGWGQERREGTLGVVARYSDAHAVAAAPMGGLQHTYGFPTVNAASGRALPVAADLALGRVREARAPRYSDAAPGYSDTVMPGMPVGSLRRTYGFPSLRPQALRSASEKGEGRGCAATSGYSDAVARKVGHRRIGASVALRAASVRSMSERGDWENAQGPELGPGRPSNSLQSPGACQSSHAPEGLPRCPCSPDNEPPPGLEDALFEGFKDEDLVETVPWSDCPAGSHAERVHVEVGYLSWESSSAGAHTKEEQSGASLHLPWAHSPCVAQSEMERLGSESPPPAPFSGSLGAPPRPLPPLVPAPGQHLDDALVEGVQGSADERGSGGGVQGVELGRGQPGNSLAVERAQGGGGEALAGPRAGEAPGPMAPPEFGAAAPFGTPMGGPDPSRAPGMPAGDAVTSAGPGTPQGGPGYSAGRGVPRPSPDTSSGPESESPPGIPGGFSESEDVSTFGGAPGMSRAYLDTEHTHGCEEAAEAVILSPSLRGPPRALPDLVPMAASATVTDISTEMYTATGADSSAVTESPAARVASAGAAGGAQVREAPDGGAWPTLSLNSTVEGPGVGGVVKGSQGAPLFHFMVQDSVSTLVVSPGSSFSEESSAAVRRKSPGEGALQGYLRGPEGVHIGGVLRDPSEGTVRDTVSTPVVSPGSSCTFSAPSPASESSSPDPSKDADRLHSLKDLRDPSDETVLPFSTHRPTDLKPSQWHRRNASLPGQWGGVTVTWVEEGQTGAQRLGVQQSLHAKAKGKHGSGHKRGQARKLEVTSHKLQTRQRSGGHTLEGTSHKAKASVRSAASGAAAAKWLVKVHSINNLHP